MQSMGSDLNSRRKSSQFQDPLFSQHIDGMQKCVNVQVFKPFEKKQRKNDKQRENRIFGNISKERKERKGRSFVAEAQSLKCDTVNSHITNDD